MTQKNILIIGLGTSGMGAVRLAKKHNYNVRVTTDNFISNLFKLFWH